MLVDYIRVYRESLRACTPGSIIPRLTPRRTSRTEDPGKRNVGCDPVDRPTAAYIARYIDSYTNPNIVSISQQNGTALNET
jgi:hypothetical protein